MLFVLFGVVSLQRCLSCLIVANVVPLPTFLAAQRFRD